MTNGAQTTALATAQNTQGFGTTTEMAVHETAGMAVAKQAEAEVQARYIMALKRPRDMDTVRIKLLKECERSGFAEGAMYKKPVGNQKIEGLSIRFAESAMRALGNLLPQTMIKYDDDEKMIVCIMLTDLESNLTFNKDIIIKKTVERRKLKQGQKALSERLNSYGDVVYLVPATDDEIMTKFNSQESKILRNHTMRVLPSDIQEECIAKIKEMIRANIKNDPDAERKKIVDAFNSIGVKPKDLHAYLGHDLDKLSQHDIEELRSIFGAIRDGEAKWADFVEIGEAVEGLDGEKQQQQATSRTDRVKKLLAGKKKGTAPAAKQQEKKAAAKKKQQPAKQAAKKKAAAKKDEPEEMPPPEVIEGDGGEAVEGADLLQEAYDSAKEVVGNINIMNSVLKAAELPITPFETWNKDQVVFGLYLLNEIAELGQVPSAPEAPFWIDEDDSGAIAKWRDYYTTTLVGEGIIEEGSLM